MLRHCFSREIKNCKTTRKQVGFLRPGFGTNKGDVPLRIQHFRATEKKRQNTTTATGRKNKTFKKLLDLASVIPSTSNIHIIHTCEQNSCWLGAVVMETISS